MKWTIVTEDFPPGFIGGIASWAYDLASALHENGERVCVFARQSKGTKIFDAQQPFSITRMRGRAWGQYKSYWVQLALLRHETDILLFANWELSTKMYPSQKHKRLWVAAHGSDLTRKDIPLKELRSLSGRVECWLPVSEFLQGILHHYLETQLSHVLPMPLRIAKAPAPFRIEKPLLLLSRNTPFKGISQSILLSKNLGRSIWIVGHDGESSTEVKYLGRLPKIQTRAIIRQCSAVILLSQTDPTGFYAEGLGLCLLEGAAEGVIGIGAPTGGIPEAIGPGILIDPDNPDIEKIQLALSDPFLGKKAWEWVQARHGPQKAVDALRCLV